MPEAHHSPAELASGSLPGSELVLGYGDALDAIDPPAAARCLIVGWEGWVRHRDGGLGHHPLYQGCDLRAQLEGESWTSYVREAGEVCRRTIMQNRARWARNPIPIGANSYYCITQFGQNDDG